MNVDTMSKYETKKIDVDGGYIVRKFDHFVEKPIYYGYLNNDYIIGFNIDYYVIEDRILRYNATGLYEG